MIRNYFKAALRNLIREKGNTLINITGLTLGLSMTLILFLIVYNGRSYDTYHTNFDRIFRIVSSGVGNSGITYSEAAPPALPEAFKSDFAGVDAVAFTSYRRNSLVAVPQPDGTLKKYEEPDGLVYTEPSFFKIFDRAMIAGKAETSLDDPNEAIISRTWAMKYFNTEDAIGKTLMLDSVEYRIAAVMEDYPSTTDLPFDLMLSYSTIRQQMQAQGWGSFANDNHCYVLLHDAETAAKIEAQMPDFVKKHLGDNDGRQSSFIVQPMKDVHIDRRFGNYNKKMPVIAQVVFTAVAIFMLLTACINFINLATAQAINRTKEVGIRKVLGSSRAQLILQMVGEAFLITVAATLVSMAVVPVALSFINPYLDLSLALDLSEPMIPVALITLVLIVTILAGLYPAMMVSGFRPALALKNQTGSVASSGFTLRRSLVVFQFFISQLFIFGTLVMARQLDFMQRQDLGFSKDAIITLPIPVLENNDDQRPHRMRALKEELLHLPGVTQASLNYAPPSANVVSSTGLRMADAENEFGVQLKSADSDYLDVFSMRMIAGENFSDRDTMSGFVVNESFVKLAGYDDASKIVGEDVLLWGKRYVVKGVVKDFHTTTLDHAIEPVILYTDRGAYRNISVKLAGGDLKTTIDQVKAKWEAAYPEYFFKYTFMDQQVESMYNGERKTAVMLNTFAVIVILIGCLGLIGLVTYIANQRTKEVGIRKVLGASVVSIMFLFSKEFGRLIIIGFLIAAPLAAFIMHQVLMEFAYRIPLSVDIFLVSLSISFLMAFITVGYRSFSASTANPVNALRSE